MDWFKSLNECAARLRASGFVVQISSTRIALDDKSLEATIARNAVDAFAAAWSRKLCEVSANHPPSIQLPQSLLLLFISTMNLTSAMNPSVSMLAFYPRVAASLLDENIGKLKHMDVPSSYVSPVSTNGETSCPTPSESSTPSRSLVCVMKLLPLSEVSEWKGTDGSRRYFLLSSNSIVDAGYSRGGQGSSHTLATVDTFLVFTEESALSVVSLPEGANGRLAKGARPAIFARCIAHGVEQPFLVALCFDDYFRLGCIFGWVWGWELCFSTAGPIPSTAPWLLLLSPVAMRQALAVAT